LVLRQLQLSSFLFRVADKPIGDIPVILNEIELAKATVNELGVCVFSLDEDVSDRVDDGELEIVPRYVELEYEPNSTRPNRVRLMALDLLALEKYTPAFIWNSVASFVFLGTGISQAVVDIV